MPWLPECENSGFEHLNFLAVFWTQQGSMFDSLGLYSPKVLAEVQVQLVCLRQVAQALVASGRLE